MSKFLKLIQSKKKIITIITASIATLVLFLQNTEYIIDRIVYIGNPIQLNLTVVDQFFRGDTLDFRLINNSDKTIAIREVEFVVEKTWRINLSAGRRFDFVEGTYDLVLPDSLKPYKTSARLFESLIPNEVNRFEIKLRGENIPDKYGSVPSNGYFILFHLEFLLNDTDKKKVSKSFLHIFEISSVNELVVKEVPKLMDNTILMIITIV